ncbi:hypothetical protein GCM10011581_00710 [Saccharopolyspora subtropica]|uniref:Intracellular proteinase inhibitor BsuPI domain-containing protein n=1 Tax=Saccharopolyspora thermophila TaxID=89367 RepID=A0A917JJH9_9PSEU|nr:hypothetical protein [Saccharopolyspora subtropica]GGI67728.1 hypothetical protein GCM10011581_00710 [Saccharopolyspora subtropica]
MFDPTGPLPPAVYWRRRAVAMGAVLLAAVLLGWGVMALVSGSRPDVVPGPPPGPPVAVAETGPPPCADEAMRVTAEVARPEFRVGDRVGLSIVVTNAGNRPCVRDTNRMLRELIISTPGGKHVWSSNDCYIETTNEQPLLQPGQSVRNEVWWAGETSAPDCEGDRTRAQAGEYQVVARLGELNSTPTTFRLTS